jgi:hypothetical protein
MPSVTVDVAAGNSFLSIATTNSLPADLAALGKDGGLVRTSWVQAATIPGKATGGEAKAVFMVQVQLPAANGRGPAGVIILVIGPQLVPSTQTVPGDPASAPVNNLLPPSAGVTTPGPTLTHPLYA